MSTILFINGHRMLQQAVAVSLFPEHEVRVADTIPDPTAIGEVDVVIIDAASLEEGDGNIAQAARELPKGNVPLIWIEGPDSSPAPQRDKLVVVKTPVQKNALHAAVAELLSWSTGRPVSETPGGQSGGTSSKAVVEAKPADPAETPGDKKVIELLDVVEEPDVQMKRTAPQTKP
jgi:hypothetical protein